MALPNSRIGAMYVSPEIMDRCEIGLHVTLMSGNLKGLGREQVSKVPHFKVAEHSFCACFR